MALPCSCLLLFLLAIAGDHSAVGNPLGSMNNAIFNGIRWDVYSPRQIDTEAATPIRIILTIGVDRSSDSIHGENLWRVDLFASRNREGTGPKYFHREQILSRKYQSKSLDNTARTLNFSINTAIEYYGINCHPNDPSFFCIEFSQGENRNFNIPIYGDDGLRNCQEIECKAPGGQAAHHEPGDSRHHGSGLPQAVISSVGWSTGRYMVSRNQPSRLNMRMTVLPSPSSDLITGTGLWEVVVFGSEHPRGSGQRFEQNRNILTRRQESQPLYPGEEMIFDVEFDFMIGQIGCDRVNYFCVEFKKGSNANPDFEIPSTLGDNTIRKCEERSCPFPDEAGTTARLTNIGFSVQPGSGDAPHGHADMGVTATVSTSLNSDRIEGRGLWRLGIFGSRSQDGSGERLHEMRNILSDDVAAMPLIPGQELVLPGNAIINLQGIGTGQDFSYFCMEFAKGDHADPDFDMPMQGGSIVSCSSLAGTPVHDGRPRVMMTGFRSSYELGRKYQDGTTSVTVEATVTPHQQSDPLQGQRLWKLGVYGSSNEEGTGRRQTVSPQLLRPPDTDVPLSPGGDLDFVVTDNLDLRAVGPDTNFPYLCVEFGKDANASPDYELELGGPETIVTCHLLYGTGNTDPHEIGGTDPDRERPDHGHHGGSNPGHHGGNSRPRALVSGFGYEIGTRPVPRSHLTNVEVTAEVHPFDTTDTIRGTDLWRLGIFGSAEPDGSGPRMGEVPQLLSEEEGSKTLRSGSTLTLMGSAAADLRGIGDTRFPYLCVEFGKANPDSHFDFPVQNPSGTIYICKLYEPHHGNGGGHGGDDPDAPNAIFSNIRVAINPSTIPESRMTRLAIEATVTPHDDTDYVPDGQFRLGVFGSDTRDGMGARVKEVTQILPRDAQSHPVYTGRPVDLDVESDLDLRGIGPGTDYPYLCVEFDRKNDHVNFDMPAGPLVACSEYTAPTDHSGGPMPDPYSDRPRASIASMNNSLGFRQVPHSNLLETSVTLMVASHGSADYIPEGVNWRLGVFGSAESDGSGRRINEEPQLLPRNQQRYSWAPGETLNFETTEELDLNGIGIGTMYPFLCTEFDKANDHVNFDLPQGAMVACREFDNPGPHVPHGGPEPDTPVVMVTSVTPDKKVKGKEKGTVDVTFDVVAAVDPSSDEVQGNNLWVLTVFMSKKKTGKGPRLGEVPQALSRAQQSQTIQNGKKIPFRDIATTLDLTGVKCKDAKYLCAEISQGSNQDFELAEPVIGCQKMSCQKKGKKDKPAARAGTTLTINSITPSQVSIFHDNFYSVRFSAPIEFDASQSDPLTRGVNLWRMSAWFNNQASNSNQHALQEQVLEGSKVSKYVTDPSNPFGFGRIELEMDLRGLTCKKLKYFCVKLTADDPLPPFTLAKAVNGANIGCSRTKCR
ncbi:uncharacterized protein [Apostichopus japonicus]|uniref:uncharacterized protein isoform X3 n=1 Tax=Stichopus japonicus TaxID=307972 RepID=UPI003AB12135